MFIFFNKEVRFLFLDFGGEFKNFLILINGVFGLIILILLLNIFIIGLVLLISKFWCIRELVINFFMVNFGYIWIVFLKILLIILLFGNKLLIYLISFLNL